VDLQGVGHNLDIVVPYIFQQGVAVQDLIFIAGKELQQLILLFAEPDSFSATFNGIFIRVKGKLGKLKMLVLIFHR